MPYSRLLPENVQEQVQTEDVTLTIPAKHKVVACNFDDEKPYLRVIDATVTDCQKAKTIDVPMALAYYLKKVFCGSEIMNKRIRDEARQESARKMIEQWPGLRVMLGAVGERKVHMRELRTSDHPAGVPAWVNVPESVTIPRGHYVHKCDFDLAEPEVLAVSTDVEPKEAKLKCPRALAYYLSTQDCGSDMMRAEQARDAYKEMCHEMVELLRVEIK